MTRAITAKKAIMPGEEQPYSNFFIILTPFIYEMLISCTELSLGKYQKN
jgi:hypothetical protein